MSRNKYPEETIERIIDVSAMLFLTRGYEKTSIQDILNELKDLTKGAIYHHFRSKEDIFNAVVKKMGANNIGVLDAIRNNVELNGAEKLKELIKISISSTSTSELMDMTPSLIENPKFLAMQLKEIQYVSAPQYIAPIIEEGISDGSIKAHSAYELAELILLLINVWINPLIFKSENTTIYKKCQLINNILSEYNIILFDEETISALEKV